LEVHRFAILNSTLAPQSLVATINAAGLGPVRAVQRLPLSGWLLERDGDDDLELYLSAIAALDVGFASPLLPSPIAGAWHTVRPSVLVEAASGADEAQVQAILEAHGLATGGHAGTERIWLLEPFSVATGFDVQVLIDELVANPLVGSARARSLLVVPYGWPSEWYSLYFRDPFPMTLARDSLYIWRSDLGPEQVESALSQLGFGDSRVIAGNSGAYFVCLPSMTEGLRGIPLRTLMKRVARAGIGVPSPTFESGLHRLFFRNRAIVSFPDGTSDLDRIHLLEMVGEVETLAWAFGWSRANLYGETGVEVLQAANLFGLHPDIEWASLSITSFGPGPSDDPTSPQITPCEVL
jgi:hypothetical protein